MTDRELMQMALDALEYVFEGDDKGAEYWTVNGGTYEAVECMNAMRALRAALAQPEPYPENFIDALRYHTAMQKQPEPEPVAWVCESFHAGEKHMVDFDQDNIDALPVGTKLYTAPPQQVWQGLTDEEIKEQADLLEGEWISYEGFARAIEAKLKEKNT